MAPRVWFLASIPRTCSLLLTIISCCLASWENSFQNCIPETFRSLVDWIGSKKNPPEMPQFSFIEVQQRFHLNDGRSYWVEFDTLIQCKLLTWFLDDSVNWTKAFSVSRQFYFMVKTLRVLKVAWLSDKRLICLCRCFRTIYYMSPFLI